MESDQILLEMGALIHTYLSKINGLWIKVKFGYHGYHSQTGNVSSG